MAPNPPTGPSAKPLGGRLCVVVGARRAAIPYLRDAGGGCIIHIGSDAGERPESGLAPCSVRRAVAAMVVRLLLGPGARRTTGPRSVWTAA